MTKPPEVVKIDRTSLDIILKGRENAGKPGLTIYVDGKTKVIIDYTITFQEQTGEDEPKRPG